MVPRPLQPVALFLLVSLNPRSHDKPAHCATQSGIFFSKIARSQMLQGKVKPALPCKHTHGRIYWDEQGYGEASHQPGSHYVAL